mmetsp:Transcript_25337/g.51586  ORF Transcript_25337/g.51586 Transcript_25337/m.51586 type:complete len:291 (-) Transcript_25337:1340-2212(-)
MSASSPSITLSPAKKYTYGSRTTTPACPRPDGFSPGKDRGPHSITPCHPPPPPTLLSSRSFRRKKSSSAISGPSPSASFPIPPNISSEFSSRMQAAPRRPGGKLLSSPYPVVVSLRPSPPHAVVFSFPRFSSISSTNSMDHTLMVVCCSCSKSSSDAHRASSPSSASHTEPPMIHSSLNITMLCPHTRGIASPDNGTCRHVPDMLWVLPATYSANVNAQSSLEESNCICLKPPNTKSASDIIAAVCRANPPGEDGPELTTGPSSVHCPVLGTKITHISSTGLSCSSDTPP